MCGHVTSLALFDHMALRAKVRIIRFVYICIHKIVVLSGGANVNVASGWKTTRAVALRFSYGVWWGGATAFMRLIYVVLR